MQHIIPTIRRGEKEVDLWTYHNQFFDGEKAFQKLRPAIKQAKWYEWPEEQEPLKNISIAKNDGRTILSCITVDDVLMVLFPSETFGGHCYVSQGGSDFKYLGTCEDVHQAYLDKIHTETRYIERSERRFMGRGNAWLHSDYQQQAVQSFVNAAKGARTEWLSQLNRFLVACGEINVGLSYGGSKPTDLVPKSLQYK